MLPILLALLSTSAYIVHAGELSGERGICRTDSDCASAFDTGYLLACNGQKKPWTYDFNKFDKKKYKILDEFNPTDGCNLILQDSNSAVSITWANLPYSALKHVRFYI
jgi:hypothetical protein